MLPSDQKLAIKKMITSASSLGGHSIVLSQTSLRTPTQAHEYRKAVALDTAQIRFTDSVENLGNGVVSARAEGHLHEEASFSIDKIEGLDVDVIHDSHHQIISYARAFAKAIRRKQGEVERKEESQIGEGEESQVFPLGERHVLKVVKPEGILTFDEGKNSKSNDYRHLALKVKAINETDGIPTSSFLEDGELYILQDKAAEISQEEYNNFTLQGKSVSARFTYLINIGEADVYISDLDRKNLMRDSEGVVRIIDLVASVGSGMELKSPTDGDASLSIAPAQDPLISKIQNLIRDPET